MCQVNLFALPTKSMLSMEEVARFSCESAISYLERGFKLMPDTNLRAALAAAMRDRRPYDADRLDRRDPALIAALLPVLERIAHGYLRLRVEGIEHLQQEKALFVANHNGGIMGPDLFCTMSLLWRELGPKTPLYALAHDFAMRQMPPLGRLLQRLGAISARQDNARRALAEGGRVLVYPGGDLDAYRSFRRQHEVVFGQRTGFVRLAIQEQVPIVPIVAHGAHRSAIIFHEGEWLARALGLGRWGRLQRFPLALALPWGVSVGPWNPYLPLPFPVRLRILAPMSFDPMTSPEVARDAVVTAMQDALTDMARRP